MYMKEYDYLVVGAGLFAAVFVRQAIDAGKRCLVIDKRSHIGGNIYCENVDGIHVHLYGAHIFHTDNKEVWDYVNRFVTFNRYTNSPLANYEKVCRNTRCAFFFFIDYKNRFIFFKLRYFEDFFGLCVRNI